MHHRVDLAEIHAWEARQAFAKTVAKGESGARPETALSSTLCTKDFVSPMTYTPSRVSDTGMHGFSTSYIAS